MKQKVTIKKVSIDEKKRVSVTVEFKANTAEAQVVVMKLIDMHVMDMDIEALQTELDL